jgi:hypothetical protein
MKIYLRILYFTIIIIILHAALGGVARAADPATGYIMGRVTLPDESTGVPGCEVQVLGRNDAPVAKTATDASGNFYFTNLPPSGESWGYRLVVKKGSWGHSTTQQFPVMEGGATQAVVKIFPYIGALSFASDRQTLAADGSSRANLTATLYDVEGRPVPDGIHVRFTQSSFYPDPGKFFADGANGTEVVAATRDGKVLLQYGDVPGDTLSRGARIDAAVVESDGARALNLTFGLANPNVITGKVYDATGRPVPHAAVFLARWDGVGKYTGYNSTEGGNATDGRGRCDAGGTYRFAIMPAGDYMVTASESTFANSTLVTVVRGKYEKDIVLPMSRGSIKGWIKDAGGNAVAGATVALIRAYDGSLQEMATNASDAGGQFLFEDVWYGQYNIQAVVGNQTVDTPLVLDLPKTSVTITLLSSAPSGAPTQPPADLPGNATPAAAPHVNATATPRLPTPTPPPVTLSYLATTYGVAFVVLAVICLAGLFIVLMLRPRQL